MVEWEVYSIRYAERNARSRADSFIADDDHAAPHAMDYFMWLLRSEERTILVDTGYDHAEARARNRPILLDPGQALAPFGLTPDEITEVILTHLHYDHAGGLAAFPNARVHLQAAEMQFATGPCMCHDVLRSPFSGSHVCETIMRLYQGKLIFHDGIGEITDGVSVHCVGGHSRGLQCVRVRTKSGWMVLASDASHYYENFISNKPFPIVVDMEDMLKGFSLLRELATSQDLIVPGHDPLVRQYFVPWKAGHVHRLDIGPRHRISV